MNEPTLQGDRALQSVSADKLGFGAVASRIATALIDHASSNGLVVGLEGQWGSGKSSLLFLIKNELSKLEVLSRPTWIDFRPWLIGNRDALLANVFDELAKGIAQVEAAAGDASKETLSKAKVAGEALRKFADGLGKAGGVIEVAGEASGIGPVKWIGKGLKALRGLTSKEAAEPPIGRLKEKLATSLEALDHRFIVTIDDVDRLEPSELTEVLRLVRSVADLPNVIYLLCYDAEILAHSVQQAAKVKDGRAYLEKMVQLTIMVPKPEPLQLRQWFTDELASFAMTRNPDEQSRLGLIVDFEGGLQLTTPRAVVRALDSLRFYWPPLRDQNADLPDAVWIQLIKNGNPALYRWIERYCATASALSLGTARVEESYRAAELRELRQIVGEHHFADVVYNQIFSDELAGLEITFDDAKLPFKLHQRVGENERDRAILHRRLSSPDHFRLYFALANPTHALSQSDFDEVWKAAASTGNDLVDLLLRWHKAAASNSLSKADVFLERLRSLDVKAISAAQAQNLLLACSNAMDPAYRARPFDLYWVNSIWDRAERCIPSLISRLTPKQRSATIKSMFNNGKSIGWLTKVFRRETFAHGRFGERQRPETEWIFTDPELDQITSLMLKRYAKLAPNDLLSAPNPGSILFGWQQAGDELGPRKLVALGMKSDQGFVEMLEALRSAVNSTDGQYYVLRRQEIAHFLEFDNIKNRLIPLTASSHPLSDRATALVDALSRGSDDY